MSHDWLHLKLQAPLMAWGGIVVDNNGPTEVAPTLSALTGLLGNALGWDRQDHEKLDALQSSIIFGCILTEEGEVLTDLQTAQLGHRDVAWTTRDMVEERSGGSATYKSPLMRRREYLADFEFDVVLRVQNDEPVPMGLLEDALNYPARPLFFGRKPCLPSGPIFQGIVQGKTSKSALEALGISGRAFWDLSDGEAGLRHLQRPEIRNHKLGHHVGQRTIVEGRL